MSDAVRPVRQRHRPLLLIAGILLVAANLRVSFTGVGPLLPTIRADTGMTASEAGVLTMLPPLCFAFFSPIASTISRRIGIERAIFAALLLLCASIVLRSVPVMALLWAGSVGIGAAIAMANVLLPGLIRRDLPNQVGPVTAAYTAVMGTMAATGAGIAVPLAGVLPGGWRTALGLGAGVALIAAAAWLPRVRIPPDRAPADGAADGVPWRSALAWQVTAFMGLQSLGYYTMLAWLPSILHSYGFSLTDAGWLLFAFQLVGVASSALSSILLRRLPDQRALAAGGSLAGFIGFLGLMLMPSLAPLWTTVAGIGGGVCITLALSFFGLRSGNSDQAASLSGMAQSIGYLFAAFGPVVFGLLHDTTQAWMVSLATLTAVTGVQVGMGVLAGRARRIGAAGEASER